MLSLVALTGCGEKVPNMLVFGHRGAAGYVMENTLPSISKAIELGIEAVEIDVYRCATGEIVVFHDDNLSRLAGINKRIEELSLEEIKAIELRDGSQIPRLDEVMSFIKGKIGLNIELKGENTAKGTFKLVRKHLSEGWWSKGQILISSFNTQELEVFRSLDQTIDIAVITDKDPVISIPVAKKLEAIAIHPDHKTLNKVNIDLMHENGLRVHPWTVNDFSDLQRMTQLNIDGVFSDYPDFAKQVVNRHLVLSKVHYPQNINSNQFID